MAEAPAPAPNDRDLASMAEARALASKFATGPTMAYAHIKRLAQLERGPAAGRLHLIEHAGVVRGIDHNGDVVYGNIGAPDRLDFTVIGPAVNLVSRLESLTKTVNRPMLMSSDFAKLCPRPTQSLGFHSLHGVAEPHEVFTLS